MIFALDLQQMKKKPPVFETESELKRMNFHLDLQQKKQQPPGLELNCIFAHK